MGCLKLEEYHDQTRLKVVYSKAKNQSLGRGDNEVGLIVAGLNHVMHGMMGKGNRLPPGDDEEKVYDGGELDEVVVKRGKHANTALDISGGLMESFERTVRPGGGKWLGNNGRYYNDSWGGNGYTGGRSGAIQAANIYRYGSWGITGISVGFGTYDTYVGYRMDGNRFGYNAQYAASSMAGGLAGGWAGAYAGAKGFGALGLSVGGFYGGIIGAVFGGFAGGISGGMLGSYIGQESVNFYH
jgi:hypothetical protein